MNNSSRFNFPFLAKVATSIRKQSNPNLSIVKIRDFYFQELQKNIHTTIEKFEDDLIIFSNQESLFDKNYFRKNRFESFNYGELKVIDKGDYFLISCIAEMKRGVEKILYLVCLMSVIVFFITFTYFSINTLFFASVILIIPILIIQGAGFFISKKSFKIYLDRIKNEIERNKM